LPEFSPKFKRYDNRQANTRQAKKKSTEAAETAKNGYVHGYMQKRPKNRGRFFALIFCTLRFYRYFVTPKAMPM
jgi:hypothetical protein